MRPKKIKQRDYQKAKRKFDEVEQQSQVLKKIEKEIAKVSKMMAQASDEKTKKDLAGAKDDLEYMWKIIASDLISLRLSRLRKKGVKI